MLSSLLKTLLFFKVNSEVQSNPFAIQKGFDKKWAIGVVNNDEDNAVQRECLFRF